MKALVLDVESTTHNKGHPFDDRNVMCVVSACPLWYGTRLYTYKIEYDDEPYGNAIRSLQDWIDECDIIVGFNIKFDLHWLRKYGIRFQHKKIWDCQIAEFVISGQTLRLEENSLELACSRAEIGHKIDKIKEYWKNDIDTKQIPWDELVAYVEQDVSLTGKLYQAQLTFLFLYQRLYRIILLDSLDLLVLEEMEWNGLLFDKLRSIGTGDTILSKKQEIESKLSELVDCRQVNWNSNDQVSIILYGGTLSWKEREPYDFTYKAGKQKGTTVVKSRFISNSRKFERLVEPLERTERDKEGYFFVGEPILRKLKAKGLAKSVISLLLERARQDKLIDYYHGIPKLMDTMHWNNNIIHGNLNKVNVITGRLSSNKPNQQNFDGEIKNLFITRY
jgi:DNA polymerase-1